MNALFFSILLFIGFCSTENKVKNTMGILAEDSQNQSPDSTFLSTGWYHIIYTNNGISRQLDKSTETYFIDKYPIVTPKNFTALQIYESDAEGAKYIGMMIGLDEKGTERWSIATEKAIGYKLAFILDNKLLYVPKVNAQITSGITALNRGNYSRKELENFKAVIEAEK